MQFSQMFQIWSQILLAQRYKLIENETGEKITLHSILADWIKKCCLEIVS
jgi:hypothetical protein